MKTKIQFVNPLPVTENEREATSYDTEAEALAVCQALNSITTPVFDGKLAGVKDGMNWQPEQLSVRYWVVGSNDQNGSAGTAGDWVYFKANVER